MTAEQFKETLKEHGLTVMEFMELWDDWSRIHWGDREKMIKECIKEEEGKI